VPRPFIFAGLLVAFLASLAPSAQASAPPTNASPPAVAPTSSASSSAPVELDFETVVRLGEAARANGHEGDAKRAYLYALQLRPKDPTVLGRLGLVEAEASAWVKAASYLDDAVHANGGATEEEKETFGKMLARAINQVAIVQVSVNVVGAVVLIDGVARPKRRASFFSYIEPGLHEISAEAEGYLPFKQTFTAAKGGTVPLEINLVAMPSPAPAKVPLSLSTENATADQEKPAERSVPADHSMRVVIGLGGVAAWGVAPGTAVGPVGSFALRWPLKGFDLSAGLDFRGVRGFGDIERAPGVALWSLAATMPVCVHRSPILACILGQVDGLVFSSAQSVNPGLAAGARIGAEFTRGAFGVRLWGDVTVRSHGPAWNVAGERLWTGSPIGAAIGIAGVFSY